MLSRPLLLATGDERVDTLLGGIVAAFDAAFPARIAGYYVLGSYADGTRLATSDLDLTIVFRGAFDGNAERDAALRLCADWTARSPLELDLEVEDEATLRAGVSPTLKLGSMLLAGEDIRDSLPMLPLDEWTRDRMHTSYWRVVKLFGRPVPVTLPLAAPDPAAEFFGYTARLTRVPDGRQVPGTRDLIRSVGWAATALVAWRAGQYVGRKREAHRLYAQYIGGPHATLIRDVYIWCRDTWQCLIPADAEDRNRLRDICQRTLAFENDFVAAYVEYVTQELAGSPAARARALEVLTLLPLADEHGASQS
jgi:Nucleotidyltransferase domain